MPNYANTARSKIVELKILISPWKPIVQQNLFSLLIRGPGEFDSLKKKKKSRDTATSNWREL